MEAVAYRMALVFDKLAGLLQEDIQIVAGGEALRSSPLWLQIVTDVLGREVNLTAIRETSARGAALLAFEALGLIEDLSRTPNFIEDTYVPDSERHAIYRSALKRQIRLYEKLITPESSVKAVVINLFRLSHSLTSTLVVCNKLKLL